MLPFKKKAPHRGFLGHGITHLCGFHQKRRGVSGLLGEVWNMACQAVFSTSKNDAQNGHLPEVISENSKRWNMLYDHMQQDTWRFFFHHHSLRA